MISSNDSSTTPPVCDVYRRSLRANVAAACTQVGYESANKVAVETLVELLQSYITEIARNAQLHCEHSGRTKATYLDILISLANAGFPISSLIDFINKERSEPVGVVSYNVDTNNSPVILQVGTKRKFPNYIQDTFNYPQLPDPHTYIRTTTGVEAESDYVALRERSASCKRNVEKALTQFVARTNKSYPLLAMNNGESAYSLIDTDPSPDSYLEALLPSQEDLLRLREFDKDENEKDEDPASSSGATTRSDDKESCKIEFEQDQLSPRSARNRREFHNKADANPNNPFLRPVKRLKQQKKKPRRV